MVALGVLDEVQQRVAKLADVVRRDAGRHAHGDPGGAVGQEIGESRRQHRRLAFAAVISLAEIDTVLVDPFEQGLGDGAQARLGVAHGGGVIAIDVAEITLALDQRIPRRELLRHANERVVHRLVTVRMKLADDIANDPRAFFEPGLGIEAQLTHGEQQASLNGLQSVADVGQRTPRDRRERVGEVAILKRCRELDLLHVVLCDLCHGAPTSPDVVSIDASLSRSRDLASGSARPCGLNT